MFYIQFVLLIGFLSAFATANETEDPPSPADAASMARYVLKTTSWVGMATISTRDEITGYPFVSLKSMSDGPPDNSTGIPYFYMTDMDISAKDLLKDNRVSIMCSLEEVGYCKSQNYDPQDPRCAKIMLTGKFVKIPKDSPEYNFGITSLFTKHPQMPFWPTKHGFYVAKMNIEQVMVLDHFGGAEKVPLEDYYRGYKREKFDLIRVILIGM